MRETPTEKSDDPADAQTLPEVSEEAMQSVLSEMTSVYNTEGDLVDLKFGEGSMAAADGSWIQVDPSFPEKVAPPVAGPNILRVLDDIVAHEIGHYNWSDLESKQRFSEAYPGWSEMAGYVANILEDEYDDARRMREWYGMRSKRAYRVWLQMQTDEMAPNIAESEDEHGLPVALLGAMHQLALSGYVNGLDEASPEIAEFCTQIEPVIERVRGQDDAEARFRLFHVAMQVFLRFLPEDFDKDSFDAESFEDGPGTTISGDATGGRPADGLVDDPTVEMSEEEKEAVKEEIEEMIESGELDPDEFAAGDGDGDGELTVEFETEVATGGARSREGDADETSDDADGAGTASEGESAGDGSEDDVSDAPADGSEEAESAASDESETADASSDSSDGDGPGEPVDTDEFSDDLGRDDRDAPVEGGDATSHITDADEDEMGGDPSPEAEALMHRSEEEIEMRFGVDLDSIDHADERARRRWASLVRQLREYGQDIEERKRIRDERVRKRAGAPMRHGNHTKLKQKAKKKGIIRELEENFKKLTSRPTPRPSRMGQQIDPHNVVRRAAGDVTETDLFEEDVITETGDRCIGLATDISGSMGSSIAGLKIAGACIARATEIVGDEFVWEAFTDRPAHHGSTKALDLRVVTGPKESFKWEHLDSFNSARNEPTASGIRDCRMMMEQTTAREHVMIVITDGSALITEEGTRPRNNVPVEQARKAVNECRAAGFSVIGLGIGSMDEGKMEETFGGNNYRLTSIDTLADDILALYREQMHVKR